MPASALLLGLRVASLNLCTDEYLLLLARPHEIASISYLARDPLESRLWRNARRHHANYGSLEQVIAQRPTLVLTMGGGGRATHLIAGRMGLRRLELRSGSTPGDVAANLTLVAKALGRPGSAKPWIERLQRLYSDQPSHSTDAIWLSGSGDSLAPASPGAHWLRLAGLRQRQIPEGRASLETLVVRPPQVLIESTYRRAQTSRGVRWKDHPILRKAPSRRLTADGRAWTCMGPLMITEIERLRKSAR